MNILMLCTKYSLAENDVWLTNELANSLQAKGHQVDVIVVDWSAVSSGPVRHLKESSGVNVVIIPPVNFKLTIPIISKAIKWIFSSFSVCFELRRKFKEEKPKLIISFSPLVTMMFPVLTISRWKNVRKLLVQWDFFPYHHMQIGLMSSKFVFKVAKFFEEWLIKKFDVVGCMSVRNVDYLKRKYRLVKNQKVAVLPIWGKGSLIPDVDRSVIRARYGLSGTRPLAVFGGQLVTGRGLEDLLAAAEICEHLNSSICFVVIGSGPLESKIQDYLAAGHLNVVWIPRVPRSEYLLVIKACDLALVCTVRDVDVPSFPSKTIDYLRVGLPIIASVEKTTDYGDYIVSKGVGISVEAGCPEQIVEAINKLLEYDEELLVMKERAVSLFNMDFEVDSVSLSLLALADVE